MQVQMMTILVLSLTLSSSAGSVGRGRAEVGNPLGKVIELISSLEAKILKEGEAEVKAFKEYVEWCDDTSKSFQFDIKTDKEKIEKLKASIGEASACISTSTTEIESLGAAVTEGEGQLKDATLIRERESGDFVSAEGELMEGINVLERAIAIIEREMAKNPALVQTEDTSNLKALVQSLGTVLDAAAFSSDEKQKLFALVQARQGTDASQGDSEDAKEVAVEAQLGAPDPAAYKSHSKSIVDVLEDMLDKAKTELSDLRKAETSAKHNYDILKVALEDEIAANSKNMVEEKSKKSGCESDLATAEGDLAATEKDLASAEKALDTAQSSCMQVAADHEATVKARAEELKVLAEAKKILADTTPGAVGQSYSFLEVVTESHLRTRADLANTEVLALIRRLAKENHSAALAQLASKIEVLMRYSSTNGDDPFAKVKSLIKELIDRLMASASAEASEKAYCDEQMAKTEAKKGELEDDIAKLTAKIDKAASTSAALKAEVKEEQSDLAALAKQQAEMDKIRQEENAAYVVAKADLEEGLEGVRKALSMLKDYYAGEEAMLQGSAAQPPVPVKHEKATGAGSGIIGILEVVESDFATNLATEETDEADAQAQYEKITQENKIMKALQEQAVKYKTQEYTSLDKEIAELTSDKDTTNTELGAVLEYYAKIKERCIAKPETYEERKKRREAEIAGLKEALSILEGEALALLQRGLRGRPLLRGA